MSYAGPHWRVETQVGNGRWVTCRLQAHDGDPGVAIECGDYGEALRKADRFLYGAARGPDSPVRIVRPDGSIEGYRCQFPGGRIAETSAPKAGAR